MRSRSRFMTLLTDRVVRNANLGGRTRSMCCLATIADNAPRRSHGQIEDTAQGDALTGEDLSVRTSGCEDLLDVRTSALPLSAACTRPRFVCSKLRLPTSDDGREWGWDIERRPTLAPTSTVQTQASPRQHADTFLRSIGGPTEGEEELGVHESMGAMSITPSPDPPQPPPPAPASAEG